MTICAPALHINAALGECPRWSAAEKSLFWVDIGQKLLHRFDPATGHNDSMAFDEPVGCFAFVAGGGFLLGMKSGFGLLRHWGGDVEPHGERFLADKPHLRLNDGRTDAQGRFWAGTVDMEKQAHDAALYRLDGDAALHLIENDMLTCNGAAFDATGTRFYHADTPTHALRCYDVDGSTGTLSNRRILHQFPLGEGRPDGGSVDAEGFYWSALFDGGRVVRLSPEGKIVHTVGLPVSRPTMIAFGGDDLRTAYVTTARTGLDAGQLEREPLAGSLFSFPVDVPGLPELPYVLA